MKTLETTFSGSEVQWLGEGVKTALGGLRGRSLWLCDAFAQVEGGAELASALGPGCFRSLGVANTPGFLVRGNLMMVSMPRFVFFVFPSGTVSKSAHRYFS